MSGSCTICLVDAVGNAMLIAVPKLPYTYIVSVHSNSTLVTIGKVHNIEFRATDERDPDGHVVYRQEGYARVPIRWRWRTA